MRYDDITISETELLYRWSRTIRPEDRASSKLYHNTHILTEEEKQRQVENRRAFRSKAQKAHADACVPLEDGDETLIRMYGEGYRVMDIAETTQRPYREIRLRLVACHPERKSLKQK